MPVTQTTPLVRLLIIVNTAAFILQMVCDSFFGTRLFDLFSVVPSQFFSQLTFWQPLTYMFMHGDLFHILFNMLILWMIGSELEAQWGSKFFAKYFFTCGAAAAFFYLIIQAVFFRGSPAYSIPMAGSSGAVYGLLVAYGIIYSERVLLFMMIFPMKAKIFVLVLAGVEFVSTVFYSKNGVANAAHLGGMVAGFLFLFLKAYFKVRAKKQTGTQKKLKFRRSHLRLVVNNEALKEFEEEEEDKPTFH